MMSAINGVLEFGVGHGKVFAFLFGFAVTFLAAALLMVLLVGPIAVFTNTTWGTVLSAAIGCGIGTGIVNAFMFSLNA